MRAIGVALLDRFAGEFASGEQFAKQRPAIPAARAFEAGLLRQRRDAGLFAGQLHRTEIHKRVVPVAAPPFRKHFVSHVEQCFRRDRFGKLQLVDQHSPDVGIDGGDVDVVGEDGNRAARVGSDAGQRDEFGGIAGHFAAVLLDDHRRRAMQPLPAPVVAEAAPLFEHLAQRSRGKRANVGKAPQPAQKARRDPVGLRLLQHHLAHHDGVAVGGRAPGKAPPLLFVKIENLRQPEADLDEADQEAEEEGGTATGGEGA